MANLFGGQSIPVSKQTPILLGIPVSTSGYGQVNPILYGQQRVPGLLLGYWDFTAIAQTSTSGSGGKGLGGGSQAQKSYRYTAAVQIALCEGPIVQISNVWDSSKGPLTLVSASETYTVPPGGGTYNVLEAAKFAGHYGVGRADSYSVGANDYGSDGPITLTGTQKTPMAKVSTVTAAGQYSQTGGAFTFGAADAGKTVTIAYVYSVPDTNTNGQPVADLALTLFTGARPQSPWAYLTSNHPGQDLQYNGIAYLCNSAMDLGTSGSLPNYSYEVLGLLPFSGIDANGNAITDAEPSAVVYDLLTDPDYGVGWDASFIGDFSNFANYCIANSLFFSPLLDTQQSAAQTIDDLVDLANGAAIWSEGVVKLKSYGDTTAVGNGVTFAPDTTPIYDLDDDVFLRKSNEDPVTLVRPSQADVYNDIQIEFLNRANQYNVEIAEDKDDADIALYGLRFDSPRYAHQICDANVAKKVANLQRLRSVYITGGNGFRFTLGWQYVLLEPMDLVTITDAALGFDKKPVRITSIKENDAGELDFECEEFPWGTATATLYPHTTGTGYFPNQNVDPESVNTPIIFEPNNRMTHGTSLGTQQGYQIWMGISGAAADWGGCNIWISTDGTTYARIGSVFGSSRMGVLTASLASGSDPDTTDTISVDLTQSDGNLSSGSSADADNFRTACVIYDGSGNYELISYETATLTAPHKYTLGTYLRRGGLSTIIRSHASGAGFLRVDDAVFTYIYDPTLIGKTVYFKFTSFGPAGQREQSLAAVAAYTYAVDGDATGTLSYTFGTTSWTSGGIQITDTGINLGPGAVGKHVTVNPVTNPGSSDFQYFSGWTGVIGDGVNYFPIGEVIILAYNNKNASTGTTLAFEVTIKVYS